MSKLQPVKLQSPPWTYFGGRVRPSSEAVLHVSTEAVVRGLNVFEGLKGFWQPDGSFGLVALERHWARLGRSARLLHLPFDMPYSEFEAACHDLARHLYKPETNLWIRATLYGVEGHWGVGTRTDLVLTGYHCPKGLPTTQTTGISTWQRATDNALPCRIKTSSNYQVARLAKIEGRERGYSEMVLLNASGRVAEAIGSTVITVIDGVIVTPPTWESAFPGITVDILEHLASDLGMRFVRRPIERTELSIAEEMAFVGTLNDVTLIAALDGRPFGPPHLLQRLAERYMAAVTGALPHPAVDMSCRPYAPVGGAEADQVRRIA
ncbi:MAG TPA: aminotransferase class IV [Hyphomicrobiaceae bacterium]|nr:aminotransferase class IV [Hyphomicrobiaceae bacterium]